MIKLGSESRFQTSTQTRISVLHRLEVSAVTSGVAGSAINMHTEEPLNNLGNGRSFNL
jgi:hypothetical protein